ncbi:MAG: 4-hydroxyphenylpyruvate dioxygenase [Vampirovibrio sp.]|nr:4-hydroxyphenylpyruvate dioxygenase [Vampirovibrio sp.]
MSHANEQTPTTFENPLGLKGIAFLEFTGPDSAHFDAVFKDLGCSKTDRHTQKAIDHYCQQDIHFLVNREEAGFAYQFAQAHGQSACAMGLAFEDANSAFEQAVIRGAKPAINKDHDLPAIMGVGDSLIYFVDSATNYFKTAFQPLENPEIVPENGFIRIDHLTNNVFKGTMAQWVAFYKNIFGFSEVRYFDIKGEKTGLTSFALRAPVTDPYFAIPINEGNEDKSQIEEYLREYKGAGIQHIALMTENLLDTLDRMVGSNIATLDIDPSYYEEAFQRVPQVTEDRDHIQRHEVLIDGDPEGYLLQIFTQNQFGPIFFEFIQRKNHLSFGEGNFGALFRSIERDQERRGVL